MVSKSLLLGLGTAAAVAGGLAETTTDPCVAIAGQQFVAPSAAMACLKSFPYNATLANNVLDVVTKVTPFFTFEAWQKKTPAPFTESSSNLEVEFARIRATTYTTDYDFSRDIYNVINRLNDGHTMWRPFCYWNAFQNIVPAPLIALEKNGSQEIYIAPNAVEFLSLLGTNYTSYYDTKGFNWKKYAGAKVLTIDGLPAWTYVNGIATSYSGRFIDHNIRVNSVFTSYLISGGVWSQRPGDVGGPSFPDKDSLTLSLIAVNSTKAETIKFEYRANYLGTPFTNGRSYWQANCAAKNNTNGVDLRQPVDIGRFKLSEKKRQPMAEITAGPAQSIDLPQPNLPTQPDITNGAEVIKAYILPDKKTGVLMVGSFGGDYVRFQNDSYSALSKLKAANIQQLIVDTTGNGGGFVCLGHFLINALAGTKFGYAGFESAVRAQPLARKIVASLITQEINGMFYSPSRWSSLNNTPLQDNYNYMEPPTNFTINDTNDATSQRIYDTCTPYNVDLPAEPFLPPSKIIIVGNGYCASTCAMFTGIAYEKLGIKIATFGGNSDAAMNFNGLAGNQVMEWADLDTEIKTAGLKDDPLAPPDLLVNANYRVNWRYAYSWQNKSEPLAFRVERAHYRIPYTADTYMSPQNLWTYV
ncbi:peptidase S41 family protein [Rhizoctonia solani AG-3 Rhs1AP]|uniref:Peptidase S41 family protein n=1 Tax=Rhizoctonia solani AG-3 Rhs1AP TaxID=1086054 RepID=X8J3H1_9AGAM|nr:peptidase S41 family protein [Rhizoctonia solani AG-3 Rhs1AP]